MIFSVEKLLTHAAWIQFFETGFLCQRYFLRIQMPIILTFFNTRDLYTLGVRREHNQTNRDVTFSRSCGQWKITKKLKDSDVNDGEQKTVRPSGKLNVKIGSPLVYILISSIILVFSRLFCCFIVFFWIIFVFIARIIIHDTGFTIIF